MNQKYLLGQTLLTRINGIIYQGLVIAVKWNPYSNEAEYEIELVNMDGDKEWIMESDLFEISTTIPQKEEKPRQISKTLFPTQKHFKPHHIEQFKAIYELFTSFDVKFRKGAISNNLQQWILTDKDKNKAALYLFAGNWSVGHINWSENNHEKPLKGFFEDFFNNDDYLEEFLANNLIYLDDFLED